MKTNWAALRIRTLRFGIAVLAAAALALFNLCIVDWVRHYGPETYRQHTSTPPVWNGSVTGSELFLLGH